MHVELGDRSYPLHAAPLAQLGPRLAEVLPSGPAMLVTNSVVGPLYGDAAEASLRAAGFTPRRFVLPDGEVHKTLRTWQDLVSQLLGAGVDRCTPVLALGGGVTGDIVGFAAATVMRGLPLVQVPTTLLAMVDSSVGGKTGVNTPLGKNLVGAFHQPVMVHAALDTLGTLSDAEYRCGLGEVVKHALIADAAFFGWLEAEAEAVIGRQEAAVAHVVRRCCQIKAEVVQEDEREAGRRAVLNCGHTIGHAIERVLGYGVIRHGEAVGIGLVAEANIAVRRGVAEPGLPGRIEALLVRLGLPVRTLADPPAVVKATQMDKKRLHGKLKVAFPTAIGRVELAEIEAAEMLDAACAVSISPEEAP